MRLPLVVAVECDDDGACIVEAMVEIHAILDGCGCSCANFSINGRYVSLVGLTRAQIAAVA